MFNKKNSWIVALLMAVAITFIGCLDPLEEDDTEGLVETVVYDLAEFLQDLTPRTITTQAQFDAAFGKDVLVQSGGEFANNHIDFEIFEEGGVNKLKVNAKATWGAGLDLRHAEMAFRGGDTIFLKGSIVSGLNGALILNTNHAAHAPAGGGAKLEGTFEQTITLTAADATAINATSPKTIRIRSDGGAPGTYVLEQVKVVGLRPADFEVDIDMSYNPPASGIQTDTLGNSYFYLDLNEYGNDPDEIGVFAFGGVAEVGEITPGTVEVLFSGAHRQSIAFALSADQAAAIMANAGVPSIEIAGTATGAEDYRYALGSYDGEPGGAWNSTGVIRGTLAAISNGTFVWDQGGSKKDIGRVSYLILQHNIDAAGSAGKIIFESIKILLPALNPINDFDMTIGAPIAGWKASSITIDSAQVSGDVVVWSPALIDIPEKDDPRFNISTTYTATIKLSAKPGFTLDGWGNGIPFEINSATNVTYNSLNQTIKVVLPVTGGAFIPLIDDGEGDADLNGEFVEDEDNVETVFSLTSMTSIASPLQAAGGAPVFVNGGINVINRSANWNGLDINLETIGLDPEANIYKVTIYGYAIGAWTGQIIQAEVDKAPWRGQIINGNSGAITGFYQPFEIVGEIPADWFDDHDSIRINTNTGTLPFRITLIEIENIGPQDD